MPHRIPTIYECVDCGHSSYFCKGAPQGDEPEQTLILVVAVREGPGNVRQVLRDEELRGGTDADTAHYGAPIAQLHLLEQQPRLCAIGVPPHPPPVAVGVQLRARLAAAVDQAALGVLVGEWKEGQGGVLVG